MKAFAIVFLISTLARAGLGDWQEFGLNTHGLMGEPISLIKDMGATWVRGGIDWQYIEVAPGEFDFGYLDVLLPDLKRRGMKILFGLAYAPSFYSSNGKSNGIPDVNAWKRFVDTITRRYADEVDAWEVWNEPNLGEFFVGTAKQYVDIILRPAYPIIKKNDPTSVVAAPGLATLYSTKPYDYLKKLKSYGAARYIDVVSHHVYAGNALGMKKMMTETRIGKPSVLKMMQDSGLSTKPFWLTEYGCEEIGMKSELNQANCLVEQTKYLSTLRWVNNMFIYDTEDDPRFEDKFRWGILRSNHTPKAAVNRLNYFLSH